jgi:hypothetical protein
MKPLGRSTQTRDVFLLMEMGITEKIGVEVEIVGFES